MPLFDIQGKRVLFVHIPRTGGTTIENWLSGHGKIAFYSTVPPVSLMVTPQHLSYSDLCVLLGDFGVDYAFSVVRDPYDRAESEYHFRVKSGSRRLGRRPDFSTWTLNQIQKARGNQFHLDGHFIPQTDFLDEQVEVFRFEDGMKSAVCEIAKKIGIDPPESLSTFNSSQRQELYWRLPVLNHFNEYYKQDFSHLGYPLRKAELKIIKPEKSGSEE